MKRNSLTTAVVAGIAGVAGFAGLANAVDLNPDGLGQVLIYPYYTVNKGQDTLISVVNTDPVNGKAVKVRFLEGYNSREVLDFNLFLSPNDVWTASVSEATSGDPTSGGALNTFDHSCVDVLPFLPYPFATSGFDGGAPGQGADDGPQSIDRTREGYIEMIQMGDIPPGTGLAAATTHAQDGTPNGGVPDCGAPIGDTAGTSADLAAPTGGLFGSGAIVNVGQGTFFAYNTDAIDGFRDSPLFTDAGSLSPTLADASNVIALPHTARAFTFTNGGALLTADYDLGVDAVSAVFMADAIFNEYFNPTADGAATDWIITFPTKRFYVDKVLYPGNPTNPFAEAFTAGESNILANIFIYDREEGTPVIAGCPSPPTPNCFPSNPLLPFEVNALSFADSSANTVSTVFGSVLFKQVAGYGNQGWARLDLASGDGGHNLDPGFTAGGTAILHGLPVTGFGAYNIVNANVTAGVLANYGGIFRHRAHRSCTGADPACS
jgi:hypothetical protein